MGGLWNIRMCSLLRGLDTQLRETETKNKGTQRTTNKQKHTSPSSDEHKPEAGCTMHYAVASLNKQLQALISPS